MMILALDVGTSSVKAAILDTETGDPVGPIARVPYVLDYPTPDAAEVPAERLWNAVSAAAREVTRSAAPVEALGLSALTPALILLNRSDQPLGPIWTHLDRRARPAARQVWAAVGPEFLETTGNRPLPGGITAVCYRQQLAQDPYLPHCTKSYLHANGWLGLRLTGEKAFDRGNACFTGLYGTLTNQNWSPRWCEYFEVEPDWLPPVVSGDATLGTLRANVAAELGVTAGIPVKLGTADTSSAMLAAGMGYGDLLHVVGTTQVLAVLTTDPRPDPKRLTRQLGVGDSFIHVTHNPVGGAALDWIRALCFADVTDDDFYERCIAEARKRETRVALDPPFLGGDRLEIEACRASFRDLTLTTDRFDLLAALLRAMESRHREALAALGKGKHFQRVLLTGGGAEVVRKLIPEYVGARVELLHEGSLRGVAALFRPSAANGT
jgi:sugar (pentulose or hexulose) kinase